MTTKEHSPEMRSSSCIGNNPLHKPHMAADGEYVCTRCGMVLSEGYEPWEDESNSNNSSSNPPAAAQAPAPKSSMNLFLTHRLGGSEVKSLPGLSTARSLEIANRDSYHHYHRIAGSGRKREKKKKSSNAYLSQFSNACSKLGLTHAESEHAWQLFARLYGELCKDNEDRDDDNDDDFHDVRLTNTSEIACYAIAAGAAATTQRVLGERTISGAVTFAFHSKSVRDLYCIRRIIETHSESVTGISKPALTASAKWVRGRY